jgi:hypothetical protein
MSYSQFLIDIKIQENKLPEIGEEAEISLTANTSHRRRKSEGQDERRKVMPFKK